MLERHPGPVGLVHERVEHRGIRHGAVEPDPLKAIFASEMK